MHWERLNRISPPDGITCVVIHPTKNKPMIGLWTYHFNGINSYWETNNGSRIICGEYDKWCDVEDIIANVEERIEDESKSIIEKMHLRDIPFM